MSLIKDEKTPDVAKLKKYVKFHCYDRPAEGGFKSRYLDWTKTVPNGVQYLRLVKTSVVRNEADVEKYHEAYMADGYEGSIIRSGGDEPYVFQYRSNSLLKKKDFMDAEFVIVGCKEGTGKDEGKAIFRCKIASGSEFDVRCKGEDEVREEQWKNRKSYMGKELTVRYQCLSDDGIPIFPVGIAVRDYE
jgi:DNA ligase-1